jgi:hypothetical protein
MEAVFTFEGTDSIQSLIVGRALDRGVGDRARGASPERRSH